MHHGGFIVHRRHGKSGTSTKTANDMRVTWGNNTAWCAVIEQGSRICNSDAMTQTGMRWLRHASQQRGQTWSFKGLGCSGMQQIK